MGINRPDTVHNEAVPQGGYFHGRVDDQEIETVLVLTERVETAVGFVFKRCLDRVDLALLHRSRELVAEQDGLSKQSWRGGLFQTARFQYEILILRRNCSGEDQAEDDSGDDSYCPFHELHASDTLNKSTSIDWALTTAGIRRKCEQGMPSLQEIREFNDSLVRLAGEPEIISRWGEAVEALPEPDEGLDTDLSSLLADTGDLAEAGEISDIDEMAEAPSEAPDETGADFSDLLGEDAEADEAPAAELPGPSFESVFDTEPDQDDEPTPDRDAEPDIGPAAVESDVDAGPVPDDEIDFSDFEALLSDTPLTGTAEAEEPSPFGDEPAPFDDAATPFGEEPAPFDDEATPFGDEPSPFGDEPDPFGETPLGDETSGADEDLAGFETPDADFSGDDFSFDDEVFPPGDESGAEPAPPTADTSDFDELGSETLETSIDQDDIFGVPDGGEEVGTEEETDFGDLGAFEFSDEDVDVAAPAGSDDSFSFDQPAVPGEDGIDTSAFGAAAGAAAGDEVTDLEELDTSGIDEFSLGDFGAEFGVIGDGGPATEEDLNPALGVPEIAPGAPSAAAGEFQISDGDFQSLQTTLSSLPLNLKLEIGAIVTEAKGTTDQVEELIRRLAAGESSTDIAVFAGKILGRQIRIPRGYEKRTGLDFEAERQSFAYQFRENILPILRVVALFVVAAGVLGLAGYHLVFRPLHGRSLYREGLALIVEDQYALGNQTFERAREVWASNRWFYSYAEAFISERQYTLAGEKYEQLLFGMSEEERDYFNDLLQGGHYSAIVDTREPEKQGILDYAYLESEVLGNFTRADQLLQLVLVQDIADYDGRLAIGDNYMLWAETDPSRYEDARVAYARLMERYGQTDELLFRMLRYFVRTDDLTEVVILKDLFQQNGRLEVEPDKYAEMAGYLIDNNLLDDVEDVLFRALDTDRFIPEIHYNLARYYRMINAYGEEELALGAARGLLTEANPKTRRIRGMLVDTITRQGENFYDAERFLDAQESFGEAIEEYEEGLRRRVLGPDPMYGRAYSHLADILYYIGRQYDDALRYLNAAEENGYDEPNLDYKQGFILYRNGQLDTALGEFREAAADPSGSTNALLWATGNTYYRRQNYFAAEAYYRELLERVELQRDSIRTLLVDEDPTHQSVVEYLIRVNNNLGVTLNRLSERTGDADYFSTALIYLTQSIEYSENYRRDPDTLSRSSAVDLAYLNQRGILYPTPEYSLQIYNALPEDLDDPVF